MVLLSELEAQDAKPGQSQASASNAIPEQPVVSFSHSLYSEDGQVVPTLDAPTLDALNAADFEVGSSLSACSAFFLPVAKRAFSPPSVCD